jgi:hypothetical protein
MFLRSKIRTAFFYVFQPFVFMYAKPKCFFKRDFSKREIEKKLKESMRSQTTNIDRKRQEKEEEEKGKEYE